MDAGDTAWNVLNSVATKVTRCRRSAAAQSSQAKAPAVPQPGDVTSSMLPFICVLLAKGS